MAERDRDEIAARMAALLVAAQQAGLARSLNMARAHSIRATRVSLRVFRAKLRKLAPAGRGVVTGRDIAAIRAMIKLFAREMVKLQSESATEFMRIIAAQSQRSAAIYLTALDKHYDVARRLGFDTSIWLDKTHRDIAVTRFAQYEASWRKYGVKTTQRMLKAVSDNAEIGDTWDKARGRISEATGLSIEKERYRIDRILRTESSSYHNGVQHAALVEEDTDDEPMKKKLVTHFDLVTGRDSVALHGQTRLVDKPFYDAVNRITYMHPPNRPHDRELVVGWRDSYGDDLDGFDDYDRETAVGYDEDLHGEKRSDDLRQPAEAANEPPLPRPRKRPRNTPARTERRQSKIKGMRASAKRLSNELRRTNKGLRRLEDMAQGNGGRLSEAERQRHKTQSEVAKMQSARLDAQRRRITLTSAE